MRRIAPVAALAAVLGLAGPALAAAHGSRATYTLNYTGTGLNGVGPVPGQWVAGHAQGADLASVAVGTSRLDRLVTVDAPKDNTGRPVMAEVVQEGDRLGESWDLGQLCGTAGTFRLPKSGALLRVYLLAGTCGSLVSVPTQGTVQVTLVRR